MGTYLCSSAVLIGVIWLIAGYFYRASLYKQVAATWNQDRDKPDLATAMDRNTLEVSISQSHARGPLAIGVTALGVMALILTTW